MKPYVVRKEEFSDSAYSLDGLYLGDPKFADILYRKYGIESFFGKRGKSGVASIGFSLKNQKWYGWSHRAIAGFAIGDKLFESPFGDDQTPFTQHGKKTITTLEEAREAARRFAEYVD